MADIPLARGAGRGGLPRACRAPSWRGPRRCPRPALRIPDAAALRAAGIVTAIVGPDRRSGPAREAAAPRTGLRALADSAGP
ncbi:hypothetical protein ACU4GR_12220 [Methylobacterium oryzae CBMB20]